MKMTKKCIFALRLPSKSSFTLSKLRFFRLRKHTAYSEPLLHSQ